jgi:hypothetical protein
MGAFFIKKTGALSLFPVGLPQAHPGPTAIPINEFNAGGFERAAD